MTHPSGLMQPVTIVVLGQPVDMLNREHQAPMVPDRFLLFPPPGVPGAPSLCLIISRASILASGCLRFFVAWAALIIVSSTWAAGSLGGHPKGKPPERESDQIS